MQGPGQSIRLRSSARSDRGRERKNNEDSIHLWAEDHHVLAVVADGMGGAAAGEEASRIAVETINGKLADTYHRNPHDYADYASDELADLMNEAVREANLNILERAYIRPEFKGMGTTLTMIFARQNEVVLAHVGDSRAYYIDGADGEISQLTDDHTFVQALLKAGHITPDEAKNHPMGNVLYRALGQTEDLDVDMSQDVQLHVGDRLVLCSDGLTLHVQPHEIATVAMSTSDPHSISEKLVELANSRGGKDNVSVIVIVVEEEKRSTREMRAVELPYNEDDEPTIPMNPDFLNIARGRQNENELRASYGEGKDTMEPRQ